MPNRACVFTSKLPQMARVWHPSLPRSSPATGRHSTGSCHCSRRQGRCCGTWCHPVPRFTAAPGHFLQWTGPENWSSRLQSTLKLLARTKLGTSSIASQNNPQTRNPAGITTTTRHPSARAAARGSPRDESARAGLFPRPRAGPSRHTERPRLRRRRAPGSCGRAGKLCWECRECRAEPAADPAMSGSSNVAAMKKVVQQLRLEASVTRVKVSAEPRRDGADAPPFHRPGAAPAAPGPGRGPRFPPAPPRGPGWAAATGHLLLLRRSSPAEASSDRQRSRVRSAATPARGLAARSPPPLGAAPRPKRSPGRWTRPALPVRALGARSALPSGSAGSPPGRGAQRAGPARHGQDGDVAARHTECIELVPRLARQRNRADSRYRVSAEDATFWNFDRCIVWVQSYSKEKQDKEFFTDQLLTRHSMPKTPYKGAQNPIISS